MVEHGESVKVKFLKGQCPRMKEMDAHTPTRRARKSNSRTTAVATVLLEILEERRRVALAG